MPDDRAATFLQMIRRSSRGRLKVYLGYGPGVGKTYQMLQEGQRLKQDGIDVVVGVVETHGRADTAHLLEGLEVIPRRTVEYRGITIEEMDVDATLARKPQVAVVDELAHTNAPDSRNAKRYLDVQELLAAGVHVISTLNVQHLESLYDTVERLLKVKVRERVPDAVLAEADVVVNVDLAAEDLQRRLREGKVYPKERAAAALETFFTPSNLEHLRELTLREVASQLDLKRREVKPEAANGNGESGAGSEQVMVCLSSRGPDSATLLRYGSRLAGRLNRNWYAVYVQTPEEDPTLIDARTQRLLADTLTLANQLGATVFTFKGHDVADTVLRFAREYRVGNVVIGRPHAIPWWRRWVGERSVVEELVQRSEGLTVIVVDTRGQWTAEPPTEVEASRAPAAPIAFASQQRAATAGRVSDLLTPEHVLIWNDPMNREVVIRSLVDVLAADGALNAGETLCKLNDREDQGSTFLNEGVALPHARLEGLEGPRIGLGLTRGGVIDAPGAHPIEIVFMLLSPAKATTSHLQLLASAARLLQNRELRRRLLDAPTPVTAIKVIEAWET